MNSDDIQICVVLRNFKSDNEYLHFREFWIQKLTQNDKKILSQKLRYFTNYPNDNYVLGYWHHLGRREGPYEAISRQIRVYILPLFRIMKLFKKGNLIMPLCFLRFKGKYYEKLLYGEYYGVSFHFNEDLYILNKEEIDAFIKFKKEIKPYLKRIDFIDPPFLRPSSILKEFNKSGISCSLAIYLFLRPAWNFPLIDKLLDYTIGLESLFLSRNDRNKRELLGERISRFLGKYKKERAQICEVVKNLYRIRNFIVHGSGLKGEDFDLLRTHVTEYGDYLRKAILAFLELYSGKEILKKLDKNLRIWKPLKILKLAR